MNTMARQRHPQYGVAAVRLSSYSRWPVSYQSPVLLTDAGFFYAGFGDCVRCWFCGGGLRNWEYDDVPWIEHARWYPSCDYLNQRKGDLFIKMQRQNRDEEDHCISPPLPQLPQTSRPSQTTHARQSNQGTPRNGMEKAMQKLAAEEDKVDIAVRRVLEMGYSKSTVDCAVKDLRKRGRTKNNAMDILEMILYQEERQTMVPSTITTSYADAEYPSSAEAMASEDSLSLIQENQTLREQMFCKICLDKDASMIYLPCRHIVQTVHQPFANVASVEK